MDLHFWQLHSSNLSSITIGKHGGKYLEFLIYLCSFFIPAIFFFQVFLPHRISNLGLIWCSSNLVFSLCISPLFHIGKSTLSLHLPIASTYLHILDYRRCYLQALFWTKAHLGGALQSNFLFLFFFPGGSRSCKSTCLNKTLSKLQPTSSTRLVLNRVHPQSSYGWCFMMADPEGFLHLQTVSLSSACVFLGISTLFWLEQ